MGCFRKNATQAAGVPCRSGKGGGTPFGVLDGYVPLGRGETALYRSIREAVPIVDAAIWKLVRLCGGAIVTCRDRRGQEDAALDCRGWTGSWGM